MRLMGDLRDRSPEVNGVAEEMSPSSSLSSSVFYSNQIGSDVEVWRKAEEATQEIIAKVQPTVVSEERRKAVIDYVQRLLRHNLGCEVFPFGSVPLKTYLPDGDIDLTTFGGLNDEEALSTALCSVLEVEEQNNASEFVVKEVQLIPAEVKIVKCLVQNIVVDVSFNQLGGLCTQCFLEKVDRLIGKDHLFKHSIILIKAWCYYESRILGAHHGLISTYALETLILYIFNFFHSSLNGPLAVLYRFLDYFSKFDWDNYCISLNGLILRSTWPEVAVENPDNGGADLLLSDDFLKDCLEKFSVPSRGAENNLSTFQLKHLNIVDPLKEINNLGRSVSKGNFCRIRSAFLHGAQKLQRILSEPEENIGNRLHNFFLNTLDRHGSGQRPDVQGSIPISRYRRLAATSPMSSTQLGQEDQLVYNPDYANLSSIPVNCRSDHENPLHKDSDIDRFGRETSNRCTFSGRQNCGNEYGRSENRLSGAAEDIATSRIQGLCISNGAPKSSSPNAQGNIPLLVNQEAFLRGSRQHPSSVNSAWSSQDLHPGSSSYPSSTSLNGDSEALTSLSDLRGDYDSHLNSLHYGRWCYDTLLNAPVSPMSSPRFPQVKNSWGVGRLPLQFRQNPIPPVNTNGVVPRPMLLPVNSPFLHGAGFGKEEMPKQRGTGTYIPNTSHYRDKFFPARGRSQVPVSSPRSNGHHIMPFRETNSPERSSHDLPQVYSNARQGGGRFRSLDLCHSASAENIYYLNANGSSQHLDRVEELGSSLHVPSKPPTPDGSKHSNPASPHSPNVNTVLSAPGTEKPDRITMQSFHLKDDDDFPPLSV